MSHKVFYLGLSAFCLMVLLWRGGSPERWGGAILMVDSVGTPFLLSAHRYHGIEPGIWLLDTLTCLAFWTVALKANRYWTIWVTALQLCCVLGHLGALIDSKVLPSAYYLMTQYVAYIIWPLMLVGALRHKLRTRCFGTDPPWRQTLSGS